MEKAWALMTVSELELLSQATSDSTDLITGRGPYAVGWYFRLPCVEFSDFFLNVRMKISEYSFAHVARLFSDLFVF